MAVEIPEFTQANLTAINKAIASGALIVEYADKKTEFRSLAELKEVRELIKDALGGNVGRTLRVYSCHDKGL